jgi:dTDP-4-dehydrorhamnose reductase
MTILVLGATGMLGSAVFRVLTENSNIIVIGTIRNIASRSIFVPELAKNLVAVGNLEDHRCLADLVFSIRPDVVVNCLSLSRSSWQDAARMISVFALLPRRLSHICGIAKARLIHISSDGVFSGSSGSYTEDDLPDADDSYGIAKLLGEINLPGVITLRTSIIGHAIGPKYGLLEWFLAQRNDCRGNTRAIFSGFPTVVLAQIIRDVVLPHTDLHGIYHVASRPISKFDLLKLVAKRYGCNTRITPDDTIVMDRSLCADRFKSATGYIPPEWPVMVDIMHSYKFGLKGSHV